MISYKRRLMLFGSIGSGDSDLDPGLGPELVTNGSFTTDTVEWEKFNGTLIEDDVAKFNSAVAREDITTIGAVTLISEDAGE